MGTVLHEWMNRSVKISVRSESPAILEGTLFHIDDTGVLIERPASKLFIPFTAILHIRLAEDEDWDA